MRSINIVHYHLLDAKVNTYTYTSNVLTSSKKLMNNASKEYCQPWHYMHITSVQTKGTTQDIFTNLMNGSKFIEGFVMIYK